MFDVISVVVVIIVGVMEGYIKDIRLNKGGFGRSCGWSYYYGLIFWSDGCYMVINFCLRKLLFYIWGCYKMLL